jgi:transposase
LYGSYRHLSEALALYLLKAKLIVSVLNPAIIKAFAKTEMSRTKTNKTDASLLARYCQKHQPLAWAPPPPEISELQALLRRLEALTEMRQQEGNRLDARINAGPVIQSVTDHIAYLDEQITHAIAHQRSHRSKPFTQTATRPA